MYIDVKTYYVKGIAKLNSYVHLSLLQPYNNLTIIISININPDNSRHVVKYARYVLWQCTTHIQGFDS